MQETLTLTVIGTEVFTTDVVGFANFASYLDLTNMVSGDEIRVRQLANIVGLGTTQVLTNVTLTFDDLQLLEEGAVALLPLALENQQVSRIGLTLIAGTIPLEIPVRITNLQSGA